MTLGAIIARIFAAAFWLAVVLVVFLFGLLIYDHHLSTSTGIAVNSQWMQCANGLVDRYREGEFENYAALVEVVKDSVGGEDVQQNGEEYLKRIVDMT